MVGGTPSHQLEVVMVTLLDVIRHGKKTNKTIVRLKRSCWSDRNGVYQKTSLTVLKRQSSADFGYVLIEDADQSSAEDVIGSIVNLHECDDGVYEAIYCDVSIDRETGYAEDWNYKLIKL